MMAEIEAGALVLHPLFPKVLWRVLGPEPRSHDPAVNVRNADERLARKYAGTHTFRVADLSRVTDRCPWHRRYRGKTLPRSKCPGCWAVFDGRK